MHLLDTGSIYFNRFPSSRGPHHPTLVFLHDALGSVRQWKDFPKLLARKTQLNAVVYDRFGHGRSDVGPAERAFDYLHREAEEVLPAFLHKLDIKHPLLIGHSDGGSIALLYASAFKPVAIICEAAHAYVENRTMEGIREAVSREAHIIEKLEKYHGDKAAKLFQDWAQTWLDPEFLDWNIEAALDNVDCPALILQGDNDAYATNSHVARIVQRIGPNAQAAIIENCGHTPHMEAKEEVLDKMSVFIRSVLSQYKSKKEKIQI